MRRRISKCRSGAISARRVNASIAATESPESASCTARASCKVLDCGRASSPRRSALIGLGRPSVQRNHRANPTRMPRCRFVELARRARSSHEWRVAATPPVPRAVIAGQIARRERAAIQIFTGRRRFRNLASLSQDLDHGLCLPVGLQ